MNLVAEHLQKLEEKIRQLAEDHDKNKAEKDHLIRQSNIQLQTIENQQKEIEQFKKQIQALQIVKSVGSNQETTRMKDKIHDLVREIDRCIELLNK